MNLQFTNTMTAKDQAWAALQPEDDLVQAVYESGW